MLSCKEVTALASAYVDEDLPFRRRLALKMHLAMCGHCRRFVHQFRRLRAALAGRVRQADQAADSVLVERILARLPASPAPGGASPDRG